MTKEELLHGFNEATYKLADQLAVFDSEDFNHKPGIHIWSAGQVADHLLKIDRTVVSMLNGFCLATTRDPFAKNQAIEEHMYDFEKTFNAPEFVIPRGSNYDKETVIKDILKEREMISNLVMVSDITETCMDSKHPGFGQLTRGEWVYFDICHGNRHLKQLERLVK